MEGRTLIPNVIENASTLAAAARMDEGAQRSTRSTRTVDERKKQLKTEWREQQRRQALAALPLAVDELEALFDFLELRSHASTHVSLACGPRTKSRR
jgi:hypothetical protein